ncbi:MAG: hypothetical protein A3I61_09215 [Acidobacteria bacterium RIFCSPLOWO2_02_FULL_68_18]|nr:MAG: hypothetical protein A3I61_09215 [Acidobacteria bacterium RIFCSPLOWO2_02_FULL_68_18]OFW51114.1 MAG: hypothetical protein A3G77_15940 [Acidobacteria bacterium RIFCSPLOWO2_12_FULL_68_19]
MLRRGAIGPAAEASGAAEQAVTAFRRQLAALREQLQSLNAHLERAQRRAERLLAKEREQAHERASLAAIPRARLLSRSMTLEGSPSERLRVRRVRVGDPVERPYSRWVGITHCATASADVRELWERLLTFEAGCGDDVLRGFPATILDVPGATVSIVDGSLRMTPRLQPQQRADVVGVPRCTYDLAARKVGNFGHWMLDCAPQVVALWKVAPEATFLMPQDAKWFHAATLARIGLDPRQMVPWDGSQVECRRLLAFESDGRTGGGRPLSPLMELRRLLAPTGASPAGGNRRIYVSRRDAPKKRKWIVNEPAVEQLFRSRGFEVIVMRDCPLDEQVGLFKEARVVAGINGGGLTDIVFSASGTHVIVLLSDTLIRWYAGGGRSVWSGGERGGRGQLAALGDSPRFWTHVAATFEQPCHSFVGEDEMPLGELGRFLDDVLAEVERT